MFFSTSLSPLSPLSPLYRTLLLWFYLIMVVKVVKVVLQNKNLFGMHTETTSSRLADELEIDHGSAILEQLTGSNLTRKGQSVRLFDQTAKTSEAYYPADERGKPYIQNFQEGKRWYPISAYAQANDVDWKTALRDLARHYLGEDLSSGRSRPKARPHVSIIAKPKPAASYHQRELVDSTLGHYERNNFVIYLRRLLGNPVADELVRLFQIGTWYDNYGVSAHWALSDVFWQIDEQDRVHAGKIMYHNRATGKRMKEKNTEALYRPVWVHELLSATGFNLEQCLFGMHQLPHQPASKPVAIVESEKTAVIATAFEPGFIWLACGGLSNLSVDKCNVLTGRSITLFPDLGGYDQWTHKANEFKRMGHSVRVSSILEGQASVLDRKAGLDIADYLTAHRCLETGRALSESDGYPALWDCELMNTTPTIHVKTLAEYLAQNDTTSIAISQA